MADLPEKRVPMEGGWGSSVTGISLTSLSLLIVGLLALCPQTTAESFILSLITAACLLGTGAAVLTLVSDYPLILSSANIFLLLLFWRLRNLNFGWLLILSVVLFALAILTHCKRPDRRQKGRRSRQMMA